MRLEQKSTEKLWTKNFILINIFSLFTSTGNFMMTTGIPLYAVSIGGDESIAGLMMGLFMVVAILFRPYFGKLLDERNKKTVLAIGVIINFLSFISYTFAFSVGLLMFLRALNGAGFSATTNASGTVVADIIPSSRLAEGVGYFGIANTLATAIGPGLCLLIINQYSYEVLFMTVIGLSLVSLVVTFFIDYEKNNSRKELPKASSKSKIANMIFEKNALYPSFVMVFVALAMGSIMTFIPLYAGARGIEDISSYFTVYAITLLSTRLFAGKLADRYGESIVIVPGLIVMVISFVLLAFAKTIPMFLASAVLYGLGYGTVQPTLNAIMIKLCPKDKRGAGNSTFFTAMDIGSGGGAVIWGFVSKNYSFTWVYLACVVCVLAALAAYFLVLRKRLSKTAASDTTVIDMVDSEPVID